MSILIIKPGIYSTIQDEGRKGFQHLGINPNGAMDTCAMQTANALVLNDISEAVLEFYFPAPVLQFNQPAFIALSGADFTAEINGIDIPINQPVFIPANAVLQFKAKKWGQVAYLSVQGGFELSEWLNSYSTNVKAAVGGFEGRILKQGDNIDLNLKNASRNNSKDCSVLPWKASVQQLYHNNALRFIPGHELEQLNASSQTILCAEDFSILPQSDRMGYRLQGPTLEQSNKKEMISTAVTKGTVQLLPNGQCIVLMADHQTTGGYPRIAHIISADLPTLSQKGSNDTIQFIPTTIEESEKIMMLQAQHLQQLTNACILQLDAYHRH
ncbi:MAG: biotin-dependent carboxyltransferase family protein [Sphingobacteriia bacterium]|jgi:antagonist of KipI